MLLRVVLRPLGLIWATGEKGATNDLPLFKRGVILRFRHGQDTFSSQNKEATGLPL